MDRWHSSKYRFTHVMVHLSCNVTLNISETKKYTGVTPCLLLSMLSSPEQAAEKHPCLPAGRHLRRLPHPSSLQRTFKYASGRLTNSSAWQDVAPYSSRRHSRDCLPERQVKGSRAPCIWAFLSSLTKVTFSAFCWIHQKEHPVLQEQDSAV